MQTSCHYDGAAVEEQSLFMGATAGHAGTLVCPALKTWIAGEMAREASVLKERRKAREERALARPKKNPKGGKGGDE